MGSEMCIRARSGADAAARAAGAGGGRAPPVPPPAVRTGRSDAAAGGGTAVAAGAAVGAPPAGGLALEWKGRLRAIREKLGLSQPQFGALLRPAHPVGQQTLSRWESGLCRVPTEAMTRAQELLRSGLAVLAPATVEPGGGAVAAGAATSDGGEASAEDGTGADGNTYLTSEYPYQEPMIGDSFQVVARDIPTPTPYVPPDGSGTATDAIAAADDDERVGIREWVGERAATPRLQCDGGLDGYLAAAKQLCAACAKIEFSEEIALSSLHALGCDAAAALGALSAAVAWYNGDAEAVRAPLLLAAARSLPSSHAPRAPHARRTLNFPLFPPPYPPPPSNKTYLSPPHIGVTHTPRGARAHAALGGSARTAGACARTRAAMRHSRFATLVHFHAPTRPRARASTARAPPLLASRPCALLHRRSRSSGSQERSLRSMRLCSATTATCSRSTRTPSPSGASRRSSGTTIGMAHFADTSTLRRRSELCSKRRLQAGQQEGERKCARSVGPKSGRRPYARAWADTYTCLATPRRDGMLSCPQRRVLVGDHGGGICHILMGMPEQMADPVHREEPACVVDAHGRGGRV